MSKKALFIIPLSVGLLSICSCSWLFNTKENYIEKQNPGNIIERVRENSICSFYYKNDEWDTSLEDKDGAILTKLRNVSEFTYINKKPSLSDEHFSYYAKTPAIIFGYNTHQIEIYDNGYAVTWGNSNDTIAYYYQFDEDTAKSLLTVVKNKYQELIENKKREQEERDRVEAEYNQMIEDMTIFTVIEKMKEEERVDLEFSFLTDEEDPRYYDFTFRDDGSIYTSLKNATYSESDHYTYIDEYDSLNHLFIQGNKWKIEIHKKARTVHVTFEAHDKYGRSYNYEDDKIIDEDSLNAILNKAYELSAPKNPFGNSSSNPSSSSEE